MTFERGYEDVVAEAHNAKLQHTQPLIHTIVCPVRQAPEISSPDSGALKVFQLTEEQTEMLLGGCDSFTIKGQDSENCGVFTRDKSLTLRSGETSNTLMFLSGLTDPGIGSKADPLKQEVEIVAVECASRVYYEITEGRPKLSRAIELLKPYRLVGQNSDRKLENDASEKKQFTFGRLSRYVQASDAELKTYLLSKNVMNVESDGAVLQLLDDGYFAHVAMMVLRRLEEESYDICKVPKDDCLQCLESLEPANVLSFVFDKLFSMPDQGVECENLYKLSEKSVCRLFVYFLLSEFDKMSREQFEQVVTESLPDGIKWSYEYVNDCVIFLEAPLKNREIGSYVKYLPEWELPDDMPEKRLEELWEAKGAGGKWTLKELNPYLLPVVGNKPQSVASLLAKFARSSTDPCTGAKVFCKRL